MPSSTASSNVVIHEPFPHTRATATPFGRGGAGNRTTLPSASAQPPSGALPTSGSIRTPQSNTYAASQSSVSNRPFHTGRGGAGNSRPAEDERRLFSFDEELEREDRRNKAAHAAPVYHIGRGGSGNAVSDLAERRRSSHSSGGSSPSEKKGVSGWVKGVVRRG